MPDIEKTKTGLFEMLQRDTWKDIDPERSRFQPVLNDALELLKEQQKQIDDAYEKGYRDGQNNILETQAEGWW